MPLAVDQPFRVVDLNAAGETLCSAQYVYPALERVEGAAELIGLFAGQFWKDGEEFGLLLPGNSLHLRWRQTGKGTGIATLRDAASGELLLLSLLLSGQSENDTMHLEVLQRHLVSELHDSGIEPAFDLLSQTERPLLVSLCVRVPEGSPEKQLFTLADRCLAAAYLRKQALA